MSIQEPKNYVLTDWSEFIRRIIALCNRGYYFFTIGTLPPQKMDRADSIDFKIRSKYDMSSNKDKHYRNKQKGNANYEYLRKDDTFIIMHTLGKSHKSEDDKFRDSRVIPIQIKLGSVVSLFVRRRKIKGDHKIHYTVSMTDQTMFRLKAMFLDIAKRKKIDDLIKEFKKLNGLPTYQGINEQKRKLKNYILFQSDRRKLNINDEDLAMVTKRQHSKKTKFDPNL